MAIKAIRTTDQVMGTRAPADTEIRSFSRRTETEILGFQGMGHVLQATSWFVSSLPEAVCALSLAQQWSD